MPKVTPSQSMQGQKVTCLDGKTRKIVEVIGRGYRVEGLAKAISSDHITRKGGKFVEIQIESRRDIEDSGKGYATLVSETPAKGKKAVKEEAPAKGKGKKAAKEEAPAKGKGKKAVKEEAPAKGKGKKAVKEEAPAKGKKAEKPVALVEIDDVNHDLTQEIKHLAKGAVADVLANRFSNISEINAEGTYAEGQPVVNITMSVFIDMPSAPVFSMSKKTAAVTAAGLWDKLVAKDSETVQRVCAALELDDVAPQVGDILVDEEGNQVFFVGISSDKKKIVLQSVDSNTPILVSVKQLEAYDMPRSQDAEDDLGLDDEDEDEDDLGLDDEDSDDDMDSEDDSDEDDEDSDDEDSDDEDDDSDEDDEDSDDEDEDSDEDEDDSDEDEDEPLTVESFEGQSIDEIREYMLENMSRRELESFLDQYVEADDEENVAEEISELADDDLVDWIINFVWAGAGSEEYSEEDLKEKSAGDLKEIAEEVGVTVTKKIRSLPPKVFKKKLIELILEAQAANAEDDEDEDEDDLDSELEDDSSDDDDDGFGKF